MKGGSDTQGESIYFLIDLILIKVIQKSYVLCKTKGGFAGFTFLAFFLISSLAESEKMRSDCFQYAYDKVLTMLSEGLDKTKDFKLLSAAKKRAFTMAGDSCRMEVKMSCLDYSYKRILSDSNEPDQEDQLSVWGEAVNVCRKKVDDKCLRFAEDFWKHTEKPREREQAFQMAAQSCNDAVYGDCLQYVFTHEKMKGRDEVTAFGAGVVVCRGGLSKSCLETVYEKISPDARPDALDPWGDAVSVCSRK